MAWPAAGVVPDGEPGRALAPGVAALVSVEPAAAEVVPAVDDVALEPHPAWVTDAAAPAEPLAPEPA